MAWIYLIIAGLFEVGWPLGMRYSCGFTKLWPSLITVACMCCSFGLFSQAIKTVPLGTAYTIWTGMGTMGTVIAGMILFGDSRDVVRLLCITLILVGIVGLKLTASPAAVN